ncbi:hypothetical protein [Chitinophaga sp.]|uniref:hypothetical protein n=1 Tax=Chitinophaga sp. TaxID=1869181 RepID=UPI0031D61175
MKTDVIIEGRGLEELYHYLAGTGITLDVKYRFNHWLLSAEIAAVMVNGDREEIVSVLLGYYEERQGKDVVVTIDGKEKVSFKGKEIAVIRQELLTHV